MPEYGEIRVDYITYTTGTSPNEGQGTVTVSGLINNPTFSGDVIVGNDLTVSGTLNANGMTVTGTVIISGTMSGESMTLSTGIFASGTESAPSITFIDDLNTGIYSPAEDALGIVTNSTERLRINSNGNVGIGTTNPVNTLQVSRSNTATIAIENTADDTAPRAGRLVYSFSDGDGAAINATRATSDTASDVNLSFRTGGITNSEERMRIEPDGNVGIGTSIPDELLHIEGDTAEFKGTNTNPIEASAGTEQIFKFGIEGQKNNVYGPAGSIIFRQDNSTWSSVEPNFKPTRIEFCTQDTATTDNSETPRLVVDQDGNVGIGTTNPGSKLEVSGTNDAVIHIKSTSDGPSGFDGGGAGLLLTAAGMNATNKFTPAIRFGSTDPNFTTENPKTLASIIGEARETYNSDDKGAMDLAFYTTSTGSVTDNAQERMRIQFDGKVGIGTISPPSILSVVSPNSDTAEAVAEFGNATIAGGLQIKTNGNLDWGFNARNSRSLTFSTDQAERMRIDSSGNVGIGTSSPASKLTIKDEVGGQSLLIEGASGNDVVVLGSKNGATNRGEFSLKEGTTGIEEVRFSSAQNDPSFILNNNFGIGTNSPGAKLDVAGDIYLSNVASQLICRANNNAISGLRSADNNGNEKASISFQGVATNQVTAITFRTCDSSGNVVAERARIANDGNVFIGKTTDSTSDNGVTLTGNGFVRIVRTNQIALILQRLDSDGDVQVFRRNNNTVGSIEVTTTGTTYNTSSDYRLKENVVPLTSAADRLNQLQVHRFNFIADPDTTVDGFLAHEAQAVVPECVTGTKDEVDDEGNPVYQGIDKSKIVPLLTAALQECLAKIETLEQRLNDAGL